MALWNWALGEACEWPGFSKDWLYHDFGTPTKVYPYRDSMNHNDPVSISAFGFWLHLDALFISLQEHREHFHFFYYPKALICLKHGRTRRSVNWICVFWWPRRQNACSNPDRNRGASVLEQDTYLSIIASLHPGTCVGGRVGCCVW